MVRLHHVTLERWETEAGLGTERTAVFAYAQFGGSDADQRQTFVYLVLTT